MPFQNSCAQLDQFSKPNPVWNITVDPGTVFRIVVQPHRRHLPPRMTCRNGECCAQSKTPENEASHDRNTTPLAGGF